MIEVDYSKPFLKVSYFVLTFSIQFSLLSLVTTSYASSLFGLKIKNIQVLKEL